MQSIKSLICRYASLGIGLALLAFLPGCAALVSGPTQDITLRTDPPGAQCAMTRENAVVATIPQTPAVVRVNRSPADITVHCRHPVHGEARTLMRSGFDGTVLGNLIAGGMLGAGIDSATNSDKKYESNVALTLEATAVTDARSAYLLGMAPVRERAGAQPIQLTQAIQQPMPAAPAPPGDVSQATWIAQRTAASNAMNQTHTAPVGYVPPPPERPEAAKQEPAKPLEKIATAAMPAAKSTQAAKPSATMKAPSSSAAGLWRAHLASHRTESAAINEWQELLRKEPKLYGEYDPKVEWIDVKDRGSFARLMLGGWAERKEADAACAKIRGPQRYCAAVRD